jgi:pimeloyl-ACP methyl ester carboxylesterase
MYSNYDTAPELRLADAFQASRQDVDTAGRYITRRTVLQAMGAAACAVSVGGSMMDQFFDNVQEQHWPHDPTKIETWLSSTVHDPEFRRQTVFPRADLSSDGFGGRSSSELVRLNMALTSPVDSRLTIFGGYRYGGEVTGDGIMNTAGAFYRSHGIRSVKLNGRSMGSKSVLHAARSARSVEALFLDSGPYDLDDARDAAAARIALQLAHFVHYDGNIPVQTAVNLFNTIRESGSSNFLCMLRESYGLTLRSENPEIIQKELEFIAWDKPKDYVESLKRVLNEHTIAGYTFTQNPESDTVVNPVTAYEKYHEFFWTNFGIDLKALAYKTPGHAHMESSTLTASEYLTQVYQEIDPYNSVQRRYAGRLTTKTDMERMTATERQRETIANALSAGVLPRIRQKYRY